VQSDAAAAKTMAEQFTTRMEELEQRVDRLGLACQAMWEILRVQFGLSDEQIRAKMTEVDLRDGVADGRISAQVKGCTQCGRPVNTKRARCLYCGQAVPEDHLAR
jgi:hypothetical protein